MSLTESFMATGADKTGPQRPAADGDPAATLSHSVPALDDYAPLTRRQVNALLSFTQQDVLLPHQIAKLSYRKLLAVPGLGDKGIALVRAWLQRHQLPVNHIPLEKPRLRRVSRQLDQAYRLLHEHGYQILGPDVDDYVI
ncbi:hypothetical protein [Chitinibacter sp. ZOR0017]|uniref:hypothetical protein n=1 Tax=Chitinibacter sp. ZOR0017 TaxID=1339254 RepID=UPI0006492413|nr:hypothetical protein [Chitinibacter sp. ZOR0017]